ncbi:hypothetical protein CGRA01v4_11572 [Colletotrichum graminicola]|nr:hypothetical protein CGRA01v4_11572 [Colletotrichum graminicola]
MAGNGWRRAVYVPDQRLCATHRKGGGRLSEVKPRRGLSILASARPQNRRGAAVLTWSPPIPRERRREHREGTRNRETKPDLVRDNKTKGRPIQQWATACGKVSQGIQG